MISFDAKRGLFAMQGTPFAAGVACFQLGAGRYTSDELAWRGGPSAFTARLYDLEFGIRLTRGAVTLSIRNRRRKPVRLASLALVFDPGRQPDAPQAGDWLEYIHSFNFEKLSGVKKVGLASRRLEANPESSMLYALKRVGAPEAILLSSLPPHRGDFLRFQAQHDDAHMEGRFGIRITSIQDRLLPPGARAESTAVELRTGPDPMPLLDAVGRRWARARTRPVPSVKCGWNSWDYYAGAVTSRNMMDNLDCARKRLPSVEYLVIDEGWEPRWGAWVANWKFPEGTRAFCRNVKARGARPGIWTAPLMVNKYLDLYLLHPDWFLRDATGSAAGKLYSYGPMAYLDVTHPDVEQWIFDLYSRLRADGFEYFKVDFTQESLRAEHWHDPTVPRGQLLRKLFSVIRRAIGDGSYLLACGAPYESVTGLVDAARTTGDIHHFWSHITANVTGISARWWMHRRLWNNDPDFLIVRTPETCRLKKLFRDFAHTPHRVTCPDYWMAGREMNEREARTYALLVYVSAGETMLSDELMTLNARGLDILRKVLERPLPEAAVPLDLFAGHDSLPAFWLAREKDGWFLGVFNWEEDPAVLRIDLPTLGIDPAASITTFWDGKPVQPRDGAIALELAPRASEGFRIAAPRR